MAAGKRFVSIQEGADLTGLSSYQLRKWAAEGRLPGIRCGNRFKIDLPLFLDWLMEESQKGATA